MKKSKVQRLEYILYYNDKTFFLASSHVWFKKKKTKTKFDNQLSKETIPTSFNNTSTFFLSRRKYRIEMCKFLHTINNYQQKRYFFLDEAITLNYLFYLLKLKSHCEDR